MSLQCPQSFLKNYQKWYIIDEIVRTFWMSHLGALPGLLFWCILNFTGWEHCDHTAQDTTNNFQMSHSGTPGVLSLGKFKVFPRCSHLGYPCHMTWYIVDVLTIFFQWATWEHHGYFLSGNLRCTHGLPNQNTAITSLGTLWMYWAFTVLWILQSNWLGKFWVCLWCTGQIFGG